MAKDIEIKNASKEDHGAILKIATELSGWFDNDAISRAIPTDLLFHNVLVALEEKQIVGFLAYSSIEGDVFISWLGVARSFQGSGIGTKLVKYLENKLFSLKINKLKVETLSETIVYEPYVKTRAFYEKLGFIKGETRQFTSADGEKLELTTYHKEIKKNDKNG